MILIAKISIENLITKGKHYECQFDFLLNSINGEVAYIISGDDGSEIRLAKDITSLPDVIDIGSFYTVEELRDNTLNRILYG